MNSWHRNSLPYGHQRSVSAVGYHEALFPNYDSSSTAQLPLDNRDSNQYYASHMDIRNTGNKTVDSRQQFSWRSPARNQSTNEYSEKSRHSSVQRPFESAFKAAISKMKESSINRLSDVDKDIRSTPPGLRNVEDLHNNNKNYMTLQPKKSVLDSVVPRQSNKVFRCKSVSSRAMEEPVSMTSHQRDYVSETESEMTDFDSIRFPGTEIFSSQGKYHKEPIENSNGITNGFKSGSRIVIPATSNSTSKKIMPNRSVVSETYISPTIINKSQSANPNMNRSSIDLEETTDCEPLPSVQEIIAKVEALSHENNNKMMSTSLVLTSEKPPLMKLQKSGSQRALDGYSSSNQSDQSSLSLNRKSGLYKKNNPIPQKENSVKKMPVDFQKLHSAFLEQKQEILNLKRELEEKKSYIIQLESDIRNYEPWR